MASVIAERLPLSLLIAGGEVLGRLAVRLAPAKVAALAANLGRVDPELSEQDLHRLARDGFASYGRYWAETLRLPSLSAEAIDKGFEVDGYHHLVASRDKGFGPIMVLPHLGGWEWAAAWLGRVAELPVSAVVERLDDDDVFTWFTELRRSYGVSVLPLESGVFTSLVRAVEDRHVVCLLGDRDLTGTGVEVDFFGAPTSLPTGPAVLSLRTGAPIHPTAVFFDGRKRRCVVGAPIWPTGEGRPRDEIAATTSLVARQLESYIREAPEQWHVLEPIYPGEAGRA